MSNKVKPSRPPKVSFTLWLSVGIIVGIVIVVFFLKSPTFYNAFLAEFPSNIKYLESTLISHLQMATLDFNLGHAANHDEVTVYFATDRTFTMKKASYYQSGIIASVIVFGLGMLLSRFVKHVRITIVGTCIVAIVLGAFCFRAIFDPNYGTRVYESGRGDLTYGWCNVGIPFLHRRGDLERPVDFLGLEFFENPEKHIVSGPPQRLDKEKYFEAISRTLERFDPEILVFVHGYNVSFEAAARRTGQMVYDLPFHGVASFFSWPSGGKKADYLADEASVKYAQKHLRDYLTALAERTGAASVHLVAHSMGSRALTEALRSVVTEIDSPDTKFTQLILAAPDIDRDYFIDTVLPELSGRIGRITIYASSNDKALNASHSVHNSPRVGQAGPGLVVREELDTIDASNIDTDWLGHSYFADSTRLLTDIFGVIRGHTPTDRGGLMEDEQTGLPYWKFIQ